MPDAQILVAVAQFAPGEDPARNLADAGRLVAQAAERGANLVVLPEYSSFFAKDPHADLRPHAESLDGPFVAGITDLAERTGVLVVAGMLEAAERKVSNTLVAVDAGGVVATYRKQHLYDAFGDRESDRIAAGATTQPEVFRLGPLTVGMQTCYDIRFPEVTRRLVDAGADLVLVPAEWVRGPLKEHHWRTLVTARAIENTIYVAAADHTPPVGIGTSLIVDPMGVAVAALGEQEGVALAPVSPERIAQVRAVNPALALRRYSVVPR